jgi:hypothetical protein
MCPGWQVPFRLTRMLVKAMEVSGIEGNFRSTCCAVMHVLRSNKDSVRHRLNASLSPLPGWCYINGGRVAVGGAGAGAALCVKTALVCLASVSTYTHYCGTWGALNIHIIAGPGAH